jgi:nitrogen regulatory protein PII
VKTAVTEVGIEGMTVSEVKGFGHQKADTEFFAAPSIHRTSFRKSKSKSSSVTTNSLKL